MDLAKDCGWEPISTEVYREELVPDAFIGGMQSNHIRYRLLGEEFLGLRRACELTKQLDATQKQDLAYGNSMVQTAWS